MKKRLQQSMPCAAVFLLVMFLCVSMKGISVSAKSNPSNPIHHCTNKDDGSDYTEWSYVYFGNYPQSEVTGAELTAEIIGAPYNASGDAVVGNIKYRRISAEDVNDDVNFGNVKYHYFKWQPVKWRVLQKNDKTLFVVADKAVDCKKYASEEKETTWETSELRSWLNGTFYSEAFTKEEQTAIVMQNVVNEDNTMNGESHITKGGNNTNDNVYLLSLKETLNPSYGFCSEWKTLSGSRYIKISDYAHIMGGVRREAESEYFGNTSCILRSSGYDQKRYSMIDPFGTVNYAGHYVNNPLDAVLPAMHIDVSSELWKLADDGLKECEHEYEWTITKQPTETEEGVKTEKCKHCGVERNKESIPKLPSNNNITNNTNNSNNSDNINNSNTPSNSKDTVNKTVKVKKISLTAPSKALVYGKTIKLTAKITPSNATNKNVDWKVSNKKYASITKNGKLTLKKAGVGKTVTVTATAKDGSKKKANIKIKIMKHSVKSITLKAPSKNLKSGKSMKLKANVKVTGKSVNKTLNWSSSNTKYATVDKNGKVKAKKAGKGKTVTIRAVSTDGSNKKASIKLKIK